MNQDKNIPSDEDEIIDVDTTSKTLQAANIIDSIYATSVILEKLWSKNKQKLTKPWLVLINNSGY